MNATQVGGPSAEEPVGRKPDGRCQLNRLSPDRRAAVADYAASRQKNQSDCSSYSALATKHKDAQRSKVKLGPDLIAEAFRDNPQALKIYEQACDMSDVDRPREEPPEPTTPPQNRPA
jgi:hypothetical protein